MFIPEYTITPQILANISSIEYARAVIENTTILPHWQKQLEKEAKIRSVKNSLLMYGYNANLEHIKKYVDGIEHKAPDEVKNYLSSLKLIDELSKDMDLDEEVIKKIHKTASVNLIPDTRLGTYRNKEIAGKAPLEEILAQITELMDWYNGLDSMQTHPILVAGIVFFQLEKIFPFDKTSNLISDLICQLILKIKGYSIKNFACFSEYNVKNSNSYQNAMDSVEVDEGDYTAWLEYFTEGISHEFLFLKERMLLLERDTKLAKVSGRIELTQRQETIIEFLQDYGMITNKDFKKLFPRISEDSVLRDLKLLIKENFIAKKGSTKSSRYELKVGG